MFQWFSGNPGGVQTNNYPFQPKSQNKKCKTRSASADFGPLRKTLRNTRRIMIGSEINVKGKVKGKVKGSGRGRPLYTNNGFTRPTQGRRCRMLESLL